MKRNRLSLYILFIISFNIFLIFNIFIKNGYSQGSTNYTFEKDIVYSSTNPIYDDSFNIRNITEYTELYNATYSFTNEIDGLNNTNINFIDSKSGNGLISIINNFNGHSKVLKIDFEASASTYGYNDFLDQDFGTIEFWISSSDSINTIALWFKHETDLIASLVINNDLVRIWSGAYDYNEAYSEPEWIHIRFDFESGGGGYKGLGADTFKIYINDVSHGAYTFNVNVDHIDNIELQVANNAEIGYFDGIDYSWNPFYFLNKNLIPLISLNTTNKEINGYDFALDGIDNFYSIGYGSHLDLIQTWEITGNEATIFFDYTNENEWLRDRVIRFEQTGGAGGGFINKDDLNIIDNFINITLAFNLSVYNINGGYIQFETYSDSKLLVDLRIYKTGGNINLAYHDGSYNDLYSGINLNDIYLINLLINLEIDKAFLQLQENDITIINDNFPLENDNELNVDSIDFGTVGNAGNHLVIDVDYIGIYKSGRSYITPDATYMWLDFTFHKTWIYTNQNLFSMISNGTLSIYGMHSSGDIRYFPGLFPGAILYTIDDFSSHDNSLYFYNIYNVSQSAQIQFAHLIIYSKDTFLIDYLNIEGTKLTEGLNEHSLVFNYSGVNINNSYFYTDTSNRLQFIHNSDDTNLEYIQASFNINNISSNGRAISFLSTKNDIAFGNFRINFTDDTSNILNIPNILTTTRVILTQNKTINKFIILISDNDDNSISGQTLGYIDNLLLYFSENIDVSIITVAIITMMIPLILIITPTFIISNRIGKGAILPMFTLMSLILVATDIIPIWLFFVIAYSISLFIFLKKNEVET